MNATFALTIRDRPVFVTVGRDPETGRYVAAADVVTAHGTVSFAVAADPEVLAAISSAATMRIAGMLNLSPAQIAAVYDVVSEAAAKRNVVDAVARVLDAGAS